MSETMATDLVDRYRKKFGLADSYPLDESMVRHHWDLERALARDLLQSSREDRWDVFERSYTTLYSACPWLNEGVDHGAEDDELDYAHFLKILGPPQDIYEVGSGRARLLGYLALHGHRCVATEVTRERGERWLDEKSNIVWRCCDGVNLARFEPPTHYDTVISTHVIEHFHPDDVSVHMANVNAILKPGGRYILAMPHKHCGPTDLSEVFGLDEPICMHLREYTWAETEAALHKAGFERFEAVYVAPTAVRRKLPTSMPKHFKGKGYLSYVKAMEKILGTLSPPLRRKVARLGPLYLFRAEIVLIAHKP